VTRPAKNFSPSPQTHTPRALSRSSVRVWELSMPVHWANPALRVPVRHPPPIPLHLVLRLCLQAHQYPSLNPPKHLHLPNPSMKMKSCELCASFFSLRTLCTLVIQRHSDLFWAFSSLVLLNSNIQIPPRSAAFRHTKFANRSPLSHIRPLFQSVLLFPCLFIVVGNSDRGGFYTSLFLCPSSGDNTAQNCIFPISGFLVYRLCFSCFIREGNSQGRAFQRGRGSAG
jgi:hypothetical protein